MGRGAALQRTPGSVLANHTRGRRSPFSVQFRLENDPQANGDDSNIADFEGMSIVKFNIANFVGTEMRFW